MTLNKNNFRLIGYLAFTLFCLGVPWFLFCIFLQKFSFEVWDEKSEYIENIGYLGSFMGGTLGVLLTAGSLIFLAKTLSFERQKSDQENFDNKFFLMLERLESIKDKIDESTKNKILNEIDTVSEFTIEKTLEESKKIIHKYNSEIGHYYRMLYQILKMVDKNKKIAQFKNVEISYYTNIVRATMDFKLTQILAINTYYSDNFDHEYKEFSALVKNYNFFEHMPFTIINKNISYQLLAFFLWNNNGFGNSSFVGKLNLFILEKIKKSTKYNYKYDIFHIILKNIAGCWRSVENDMEMVINTVDRFFYITYLKEKFHTELIYIHPDSYEKIKCNMFSDTGYYDMSFNIDDELNIIVHYEDQVDALMTVGAEQDSKFVVFKIVIKDSREINLNITEEFFFQDFRYNKNFVMQKNKVIT
ncbi:putative phage abortive infection protein [Acinetobacter terrestris]|uniref:Phage abortive infection protein n=1 Tax=Acinetobacter terrestris TaxID=2529843 RepID=A0AAW6UNC5_9GAMM|nr:putative phage abortive infection protein [Acinetobacter terrestris]MDK1683454.1 putative phage abortive infection protein [Acinetobacter terrestris]